MRYLPHTTAEVVEMLSVIGVDSIEKLFDGIPSELRVPQAMALPAATSEPDLMRELHGMADRNAHAPQFLSFLGGGSYNHFIPSWIWQLVLRGEFLTPYTPYQPEISQGTLQVIFEYQSMMCELFGLEVANASNYDCSTAVSEAVFMAQRVTKRRDYCIVDTVHPEYRQVAETTVCVDGTAHAHVIPHTTGGGVDMDALDRALQPSCAACVVQYPSFFGTVEDLRPIAERVHAAGALLVVVVPDPIAMGLLEAPGAMGADIVVAEGQPLGIPVSYGGPYVGIFATRRQFVRQMPGRLAGCTVDSIGQRGFVLTLSTREQHIRREKATSNICTNQQLCALAATMYTAWIGKVGLQKLARLNWEKAEYAKATLGAIPGVRVPFALPTFHEFVIQLPQAAESVLATLCEQHIFGGLDVGRWFPELKNHVVVCVTEQLQKEDIDRYATVLAAILSEAKDLT